MLHSGEQRPTIEQKQEQEEDLVPKAEKIKQLHAICKLCHYQASFTLRTTAESSLELIGGNEAYMPVCRECFALKN